jgi:hypothetical protein
VSAALEGARCFFARCAHSNLTRDAGVAEAVVELLATGATKRLPDHWAGESRASAQVSDQQLRRRQAQKVDWAALTPAARRVFLQNLNEPPRFTLRVPGAQ